jgi:molecular chaperone DnaJ
MIKNYYKILAISSNSSQQEIKTAYRNGAKFWHPDKNDSLNAKEKFIEIQEAYEILIDPNKRKVYDNLLNSRYKNEYNKGQYQSDESNRKSNKKSESSNKGKDYIKFEDWISEIRKKAERKAKIPFVDDMLTESFHFLDKYGVLLIIAFFLIVILFAMSI